MAQSRRNFAIIGLGTFGATVARELAGFGDHVIGIDIDERRVSALADTLAEAVIADAREEAALREAGVETCETAVIAIGEELEANVLAAINAKMIGVPKVWAKATSRTHHRILKKLGVDRVVQPEDEVGVHIAHMLHTPEMRDYVSLGNGFHVVNIQVPESLEGRDLGSLELMDRYGLRCVGVMRGTDFRGDEHTGVTLAAKDKLLLLGRRTDLRDFAATL